MRPQRYQSLQRDKKENTFGDSKITMFQHIGSVVLQDSYKLNPTATGKAVKRKYYQHVSLSSES
ncbi:uncharacterized protein HD556DRAFT_1439052 [Suillus plorans]|uniref:Uncharacterized protein n=1 Tax=Suillus plorans TaxID=116603 RepID=A0A9P7DPU4_9AGAM|nr:uncharacterized protein HD556DRAFT_1439052 [Suillus plorans]KAG1800193.1 hypothetical protein HD556DRAFT_1439052 [Suillus plorans]